MTPQIAVQTAAREAIVPLVFAGAGAALLPAALAHEASRRGAVVRRARPAITRTVGLIHRPGAVSKTRTPRAHAPSSQAPSRTHRAGVDRVGADDGRERRTDHARGVRRSLWIAERAEFHDPVFEFAKHEDPGGVKEDSPRARAAPPVARSWVGNDGRREDSYCPSRYYGFAMTAHVSRPVETGRRRDGQLRDSD